MPKNSLKPQIRNGLALALASCMALSSGCKEEAPEEKQNEQNQQPIPTLPLPQELPQEDKAVLVSNDLTPNKYDLTTKISQDSTSHQNFQTSSLEDMLHNPSLKPLGINEKGVKIFEKDGQEYSFLGKKQIKVTAYCPCDICCEDDSLGITSTGTNAKNPNGVAIDATKNSPFYYGDLFVIPGVENFSGEEVRVADDTGGEMRQSTEKGIYHIDLRLPTHNEAREWGVRTLEVQVYKKEFPKAPQVYKLQSGDTISRVAKTYGFSTSEVLEFNNLTGYEAKSLQIGQEIYLPKKE